MPYDGEVTWDDLSRKIQQSGNAIIEHVNRAEELYNDIVAYKGTMTVAEMAAQLTTTSGKAISETMINDLLDAITAMNAFYNLGNNNSITSTGWYFNPLRKFI